MGAGAGAGTSEGVGAVTAAIGGAPRDWAHATTAATAPTANTTATTLITPDVVFAITTSVAP